MASRLARAFTLVELLIAIGIIAVLVGILLPVISKSRAAANRTVCASRLREITMAALSRANDTRGFLPLAGRVSVPAGTAGDGSLPAALADSGRMRYVYVPENYYGAIPTRERIAPFPAALLPTLGITDVQITEGMLANWDRFSEQHRVISVFTCPNAIELDDADGRPLPVNEIAIGNSVYITVDLVRIDYALNAGLLGFDHDSPERPLRGRLAAVQNQARVVLAGDVASHERVPPIPMLCWSPGSPGPVTLGDVLAGKVLFGPKFDRERHQGRMNVAFLDGHVEDLPIEAGALAEAWLVER